VLIATWRYRFANGRKFNYDLMHFAGTVFPSFGHHLKSNLLHAILALLPVST
jgi:hypothetical protein